jgi:ABC-type Fe3+-hydroxamate transport system substrate-binding protein
MPATITRSLAAVLTLSALAACSTRTKVVSESPASVSLTPVCFEAVTVYDSYGEVVADYREVALLETQGNAVWTRDSDLRQSMQKKAAELGANAIIVDPTTHTKETVKLIGAAVGTGDADRKGKAVAIFIPADEQRVRTACSQQ